MNSTFFILAMDEDYLIFPACHCGLALTWASMLQKYISFVSAGCDLTCDHAITIPSITTLMIYRPKELCTIFSPKQRQFSVITRHLGWSYSSSMIIFVRIYCMYTLMSSKRLLPSTD